MRDILVVCHDAGGGQLLASAVKKYRKSFNWIAAPLGPSQKLFSGIKIRRTSDPLKLLKSGKIDLLLTGTSWGSDFEQSVTAAARKVRVRSAAVLDHWVNYPQRFKGERFLPDHILACDPFAVKLAKKTWKKPQVAAVENVFFDFIIKASAGNKKRHTGLCILYAARANENRVKASLRIPSENLDKRCFKMLLSALTDQDGWRIIFRAHPSGMNFNPVSVFWDRDLNPDERLEFSKQKEIMEDIRRADVVAGAENMPLVLSMLALKKTLSILPKPEKLLRLPLKGIRRAKTPEKAAAEIKRKVAASDAAFRSSVLSFNLKHKWPVILNRIMRYN